MAKTKKKGFLRLLRTVLLVFVLLFLTLYGSLWVVRGVLYKESMSLRTYVCDVPEIHSGYAPQGIAYSAEKDVYLATGYDGENETVLYVVEDGVSRRVLLADEKGEILRGHGGGITCAQDCVYVANDSALQQYSLSEILSAKSGDRVTSTAKHAVGNAASFCFSTDGLLYVGEFFRAGNYETDEAHHFKTPNGDENKAIVSCYQLDENGLLTETYPMYAISITGLVQGFAVHSSTFILSRSYGLANSSLEYYENLLPTEKTVRISFAEDSSIAPKDVPLYYLDSTNLTKTIVLPAFSEDLTIVGDRVVVTNESACNKYIVGKLFGGGKIYSYPIYSAKSAE